MIAAELRGGNKPSLNEALGWIGSRVDDIYGASVGRLEDVWIDPGTGVPRWLLVKEGRFGGRTTLIPFEDATAGAGHVWVPYEREIVRDAPEIEPGAPLTQQVEAALRSHYAANVPAAISHRGQPSELPSQPSQSATPPPATATIRFATGQGDEDPPAADFGRAAASEQQHVAQPRQDQPPPHQQPPRGGHQPDVPRRAVLREQPQRMSRLRGVIPPLPPRPAPPTPAPASQPYSAAPPPAEPSSAAYGAPDWQMPAQTPPAYPQPPVQQQFQPQQPYPPQQPPPYPQQYPPQQPPPYPQQQPYPQQGYWPPPQQQGPPPPSPQPASPYDTLASLARSSQVHYVEIELSGELSIRGELRSVRVIPRD